MPRGGCCLTILPTRTASFALHDNTTCASSYHELNGMFSLFSIRYSNNSVLFSSQIHHQKKEGRGVGQMAGWPKTFRHPSTPAQLPYLPEKKAPAPSPLIAISGLKKWSIVPIKRVGRDRGGPGGSRFVLWPHPSVRAWETGNETYSFHFHLPATYMHRPAFFRSCRSWRTVPRR